MANSFSKQIDIYFEQVVTGFDAMNLTAKNVSKYKPGAGALAESGQTFYRPMPFMTEAVDGRDISGSYKDLTELTVPSTLTENHLRNVPISFTGVDLNNPHIMTRAVDAAKVRLSNKLDTLVANEIADKATLCVVNSGNIDSYDELGEADALMLENQVTQGERVMLLNPRMAKNALGNLAARETMNKMPTDAYTRSMMPPVAGFDTFRVDYAKTLAGSAGAQGTAYQVNGADQNHTPTSMTNDIPTDNRTQTLAVDTGTGAAVGDVFTIAGVYSVGQINKQSTGQLKTFRILAINGGNWTISPAIIPGNGTAQAQRDYANCSTTPNDNAAITILNTTTKPVSVFYEKSAIELLHADFNTEPFLASGKSVRKATTDSGIQIVMLSDSNIDTMHAKYRMFIWANVGVLNYEMAGIMLEGQV